jgi:hypothetical protein
MRSFFRNVFHPGNRAGSSSPVAGVSGPFSAPHRQILHVPLGDPELGADPSLAIQFSPSSESIYHFRVEQPTNSPTFECLLQPICPISAPEAWYVQLTIRHALRACP